MAADYASPTLRAARARYFEEQGIPPDGGYNATWIRVRFGPICVPICNPPSRRVAVPYHDAHHALTGYGATLKGEAEVAAWEFGSGGCGNHLEAWYVNLHAIAIGMVMAPLRTHAAFLRGVSCCNLYGRLVDNALLDSPVEAVREQLKLSEPTKPARCADTGRFLGWACAAVAVASTTIACAPVVALAVGTLGCWYAISERVYKRSAAGAKESECPRVSAAESSRMDGVAS